MELLTDLITQNWFLPIAVILLFIAIRYMRKYKTKAKEKISIIGTKILYISASKLNILDVEDSPSSVTVKSKSGEKDLMFAKPENVRSKRYRGDDYYIALEGFPQLIDPTLFLDEESTLIGNPNPTSKLKTDKLKLDEEALGKATNPKVLSAMMRTYKESIYRILQYMMVGIAIWLIFKWVIMVIYKIPVDMIPF